jgi:DNA-binding NtrC family response regulator
VRIIAASNQPLESEVRNGHFRSDLYHRLDVVRLFLPPLRNRVADLEKLILVFARRHRQLYELVEHVEPELLALLQLESFQGNVRELENAVQRMLFLKTTGTSFGVIDWMAQSNKEHSEADPDPLAEAAEAIWKAISQRGVPYAQACQEIERLVLKAATSLSGFTRRHIAKQLRTSERTLYYKMRAHGLGKALG